MSKAFWLGVLTGLLGMPLGVLVVAILSDQIFHSLVAFGVGSAAIFGATFLAVRGSPAGRRGLVWGMIGAVALATVAAVALFFALGRGMAGSLAR